MRIRRFISVIVIVLELSPAFGAGSFRGLSNPVSGLTAVANAISADGSTVVGATEGVPIAIRWTGTNAPVQLGDVPGGVGNSSTLGVSGDGSVIVGYARTSENQKAFQWTAATGMTLLTPLPVGNGAGQASGVSTDGQVIAGNTSSEGARWVQGQVSALAATPYTNDVPHAISGNGLTIVGGVAKNSISVVEASKWTPSAGYTFLGIPGGYTSTTAWGVSADGSYIVGNMSNGSVSQAFRWSQATGMVGLGQLPSGNFSEAFAVSADGSVVVGEGTSPFFAGITATYWSASTGTVSLSNYLTQVLGLNLSGWLLTSAVAITPDGKTIVGNGLNHGRAQAWEAQLPEPATLMLFALGVPVLLRRG